MLKQLTKLRKIIDKNNTNEINFIISGGNYYKSMSVNQLWSTKLNDNIYKFEIQLNIDESDKEKFILFVNSMNYSQIEL